jgi:ABC-type multidrug transport system fused ATPase/permease subunit
VLRDGIMYISIFGASILIGSFLRGYYVFNGYMMGIRGRKVLVTAMFNKVAKLSMKSLTRTNSGKLVTLISSDILNLERSMTMTPMLFSAIALNITCYIVIGYIFQSWVYVAIIVGVWLLMVLL